MIGLVMPVVTVRSTLSNLEFVYHSRHQVETYVL